MATFPHVFKISLKLKIIQRFENFTNSRVFLSQVPVQIHDTMEKLLQNVDALLTSSTTNWILEHAIQCLMWMESVINEHKELIDADDLFYELPQNVSDNAVY